jgi:hypothetical protein
MKGNDVYAILNVVALTLNNYWPRSISSSLIIFSTKIELTCNKSNNSTFKVNSVMTMVVVVVVETMMMIYYG